MYENDFFLCFSLSRFQSIVISKKRKHTHREKSLNVRFNIFRLDFFLALSSVRIVCVTVSHHFDLLMMCVWDMHAYTLGMRRYVNRRVLYQV